MNPHPTAILWAQVNDEKNVEIAMEKSRSIRPSLKCCAHNTQPRKSSGARCNGRRQRTMLMTTPAVSVQTPSAAAQDLQKEAFPPASSCRSFCSSCPSFVSQRTAISLARLIQRLNVSNGVLRARDVSKSERSDARQNSMHFVRNSFVRTHAASATPSLSSLSDGFNSTIPARITSA